VWVSWAGGPGTNRFRAQENHDLKKIYLKNYLQYLTREMHCEVIFRSLASLYVIVQQRFLPLHLKL
jgi:hypothetical protein